MGGFANCNSGVELDMRGNVKATMKDYATSQDGVFACGDMPREQSLVVWVIKEGRRALGRWTCI